MVSFLHGQDSWRCSDTQPLRRDDDAKKYDYYFQATHRPLRDPRIRALCGGRPYNASNWAYCSYGIRSSNFNYGNGNVAHTFYLVSGSIGKRPAVRGSSGIRFSYMTAIQNANDGVIFSDTEAPWSATYSPDTSYGHAYVSSKAGTAYTYPNGFCVGGHYPRYMTHQSHRTPYEFPTGKDPASAKR